MHTQNLDAPGFAEAVTEDSGGVRLQRVPECVRCELNERAQFQVLRPAGNEVRCVTGDGKLRLTVSSPNGGIHAVPFIGCFQQSSQFVIGPEKQTIEIAAPKRFLELPESVWRPMPYHPHVIRLVMHGGGSLVLHEAAGTGIRVPAAHELPVRRLLTYGTSITHGAAATMPHLCYARQLAWRLGADLINLGVGGACHCEPAFADYMASRTDWTAAVLALSVNMIGAGFTPDEFYQRASYMVNAVAGANPNRPVMCVTIFPHGRDFFGAGPEAKAPPETYRQKLRDAVAHCPHPNVHLAEGADILTDPGGLTTDLVHPGDLGMIQMGENLAARLDTLVW
jgi:hypothetical protein